MRVPFSPEFDLRPDCEDRGTLSPGHWLALFAACHLAVWTLVPYLSQPSLPLDTIEMLYWGREWQWGYYKHPPLPAWLAEAARWLAGGDTWLIYAVPQGAMVLSFVAAWRLAREMVSPRMALLAAVLLETSFYYNYTTADISNNTISRPFWAGAILFLYLAMQRNRLGYWASCGVCLGLGMLCKYDIVALILAMLVYSGLNRQSRRFWRTPGPYVTMAAASLIFTPHLIWLVRNDFPTVAYFADRSAVAHDWWAHVRSPLEFIKLQLMALLPTALTCIFLFGRGGLPRPRRLEAQGVANRNFVLSMVLGPVAICLVYSTATGAMIHSMWAASMWTYMVLALIVSLEWPAAARVSCRRVAGVALTACLLYAGGLVVHDVVLPPFRDKPSRIHFPAEQLAERVSAAWSAEVGSEALPVIAGPWWEASHAAFQLPQQPSVYGELDPRLCPWTNDALLRAGGGVIVWRIEDTDESMPDDLARRFPHAIPQETVRLRPHGCGDAEPYRLGLAVLPPAKSLPDETQVEAIRHVAELPAATRR